MINKTSHIMIKTNSRRWTGGTGERGSGTRVLNGKEGELIFPFKIFLCSISQTLVTTTQPSTNAGETDGARRVKANRRGVGEAVPEGEMQFLLLKSW